MTTYDNHFLDVSDLQADSPTAMVIAALAQQAAVPQELEDGKLYSILQADGSIALLETPGYLDKHADDRADRPRQVRRSVTLLDVPSFVDYLTRNTNGAAKEIGFDHLHSDGSLELWADLEQRRILAVLDGLDGWRAHQATLKINTSPEWAEWMAIDGKMLNQVQFAEFVEDNLSTIGEPDGAALLDIAQTLQATTGAQFKQQSILATGQRGFQWEETVEAKAGRSGDLKVPGELVLVLRPFLGSDPIAVKARLRFRVGSSGLAIGVKLNEPRRVLEDAFGQVVSQVQKSSPVIVTYGRP